MHVQDVIAVKDIRDGFFGDIAGADDALEVRTAAIWRHGCRCAAIRHSTCLGTLSTAAMLSLIQTLLIFFVGGCRGASMRRR